MPFRPMPLRAGPYPAEPLREYYYFLILILKNTNNPPHKNKGIDVAVKPVSKVIAPKMKAINPQANKEFDVVFLFL